MSGFFASYAAMGVVLLVVYSIITIGIGILLGKILNKKWIVAPVFILNLVVFYLFELKISIIYIAILLVISICIYLIKRK